MRKIKLFLLTLFLFGSFAHALTLSELRAQVRIRIKDANASRQRYTDVQINALLNESHRDIVNATWVIAKSTSFALVSGTTYYLMPTDVIDIQRVTFRDVPLKEISFQGQDGQTASAWELSGGLPSRYFQDATQVGYIGFYPWPNSTSSTGTVKMQYYAEANTLSSDSDIPFDNQNRYLPYNDLLTIFTCYKIFLLEGETAKSDAYAKEYENRLALMRDRVRSKPNYMPGFTGNRP